MSPYNGEILGRIDLAGPVLIPPVAADGTVYLPDRERGAAGVSLTRRA